METNQAPMKRIASVIGVASEHIEAYERHHAAVWPGVLAALARSHVHNYSIYRFGTTLFSYFEYRGEDYEADLAAIAADPTTQEWWSVVNPLQQPMDGLPAGQWLEIPEVFHTD
ncbi:L-rhamnose mutarotase [Occultella aeris]|uniref:L-rhamnose mutarotase n=1 Tax=Occultella aeris TaxID=2761496 RepID=UPI001E2CD8EB|nr:L-rhamnose mutarotase [Occultella aeris]